MGKFGDFLKSEGAGSVLQAGVGALQTGLGVLQRAKGYKEAKKAIEGLGPNQGILDYYNQALNKYSGLRAGESMVQKQFAQQARQNLAGALQSYRQAGDIQAGGAAALRAANEAALKSAALGYQEGNQALSRLGSAAQMKAAEELRPKQLKFELAAQKAAGGTQLANVGMSNIYGAGQAYTTGRLYRDIYGSPTSSKDIIEGGTYSPTAESLASRSRLKKKY